MTCTRGSPASLGCSFSTSAGRVCLIALDAARRIKGSRVLEIEGHGFGLFGPMTRKVEAFVAGMEAEPVPDTVLATILFTDIVASTERAASLGDRAWRELLHDHHVS